MKILLIPFGRIDSGVLEAIKNRVGSTFRTKVKVHSEEEIPECERRGDQLNAEGFIPVIQKVIEREGFDLGLGVVDRDLYVEGLNFVFGIAYRNASVISLTRLKSGDKELFMRRAVKEAIHELGHLFGLDHCENPKCVMHFSNCLKDTDIKSEGFCKGCERYV